MGEKELFSSLRTVELSGGGGGLVGAEGEGHEGGHEGEGRWQ